MLCDVFRDGWLSDGTKTRKALPHLRPRKGKHGNALSFGKQRDTRVEIAYSRGAVEGRFAHMLKRHGIRRECTEQLRYAPDALPVLQFSADFNYRPVNRCKRPSKSTYAKNPGRWDRWRGPSCTFLARSYFFIAVPAPCPREGFLQELPLDLGFL